jgi:hypothetical protein
MTAQRTVTSNWRARRSVSRIRYGKKTVKVIRLDDGRAGFGRRRSLAPGHAQVTGQSRKAASHDLYTTRVPGTTVSASDMVSNMTKERLELRNNIRDVIQASRHLSTPANTRARNHRRVNGRPWMRIKRFRLPLFFNLCPTSKK